MTFLIFIVLSFATWRISHLLVSEVGPYNLVEKFRNKVINYGWSPISCFKCTSVWIGGMFSAATTQSPLHFISVWFALSGVAILLDLIREKLED